MWILYCFLVVVCHNGTADIGLAPVPFLVALQFQNLCELSGSWIIHHFTTAQTLNALNCSGEPVVLMTEESRIG